MQSTFPCLSSSAFDGKSQCFPQGSIILKAVARYSSISLNHARLHELADP